MEFFVELSFLRLFPLTHHRYLQLAKGAKLVGLYTVMKTQNPAGLAHICVIVS